MATGCPHLLIINIAYYTVIINKIKFLNTNPILFFEKETGTVPTDLFFGTDYDNIYWHFRHDPVLLQNLFIFFYGGVYQ
jgi:hypothetical protein